MGNYDWITPRILLNTLVQHYGGQMIRERRGNPIYRFFYQHEAANAARKVNESKVWRATVSQVGGRIWDMEVKQKKENSDDDE